MKCGHLFNGIGGFALAAHWMGWENVFHCEIDDFCNKVMNKHFPNSIQHGNIKEQDFTGYRGTIDLITGGFPCQPYSTAGKRKGKEDERHLWPEMLRAIREIQPGWIVGENVRGLTNWNGGVVFDEVQADLETEGYEVLPFLLPAAGVNAPHRRDRIWFISYAAGFRCNRNISSGKALQRAEQTQREAGAGIDETVANPNGISKEQRKYEVGRISKGTNGNDRRDTWIRFPYSPALCRRDDGIPDQLDRVGALGNAIVPHVAYQIFKAIEQYNKLTK